MGARVHRPPPDLTGSTLVHVEGSMYVDAVTGMVLTRVGHIHKASGYEKVQMPSGGPQRGVHLVVHEAVIGPVPDGMTVNHEDGVKSNNRPDNLKVATQSEQMLHAYRLGLRSGNGLRGTKRRSKLSARQIRKIKEAPRGAVTQVAHECGVSRQFAYDIRGGRRLAAH